MKARTEWWFGVLALLPAIATMSVYAEAFLASRTLHHWPIPSVADPQHLDKAPLHVISTILLLSVLPGAIFLPAVSIKNWPLLRNHSRYWVWLAIFALSFTLQLWLGHIDPSKWEWWWD